MRTCCLLGRAWAQPRSPTTVPQRCKSYAPASLTEEALLNKIDEGLGDAPNKPRVNPKTRRVETAAGELPMSPLFDPKWIASRRRRTKAYNPKPSGRFRSKVYNNPYARALETPLRVCPASRTTLPRFFLQDFEVVEHPNTGKPWWAPGPLSFYHLDNDIDVAARKQAESLKKENNALPQDDDTPDKATETRLSERTPAATDRDAETGHRDGGLPGAETSAEGEGSSQDRHHRGMGARASVVGYALSKKSLISQFKPGKVPLTAMRGGMSVDNAMRAAVWRPDMVTVLEGMLRKQAVDALIRRSTRAEFQNPHKFIEPCASWEKAKEVKLRGCVLWLPKDELKNPGGGYSTLDVDAQFGGKLTVYNLPWLLGGEELARLRDQAPLFRENEILVLKQWPTWSVKSLHMLLWRLQGFLAEPVAER